MSRRARTIAALLTALLAGCGGDDSPDDLRAMVDELLPMVERLSGLEARGPLQVEIQDSAQVRAYLEERLSQEMPAEEIAGIHAAYAALGLLEDTLDLRALLLDFYTEQIAGYYDPVRKTLNVLASAGAGQRPVLAHELVHALQDQHTDIDSLIARSRGNDRQLAAQAALEGHATLAMFAFMLEDATGNAVDPAGIPDPAARMRDAYQQSDEFPAFRRAPRLIRETLLFPYADGARFVQELWQSRPAGSPRLAPLGPLLPQSTEQVLYTLERFVLERDAPTEIRFEDAADWRVIYENTLGALETGIFLQELMGTPAVAATGWDGDRYQLLESDAGRALVWVSVWDDSASADRFLGRVRQMLEAGRLNPAEATAFELEGRPAVRITIGRGASPTAVPELAVFCVDSKGERTDCSA